MLEPLDKETRELILSRSGGSSFNLEPDYSTDDDLQSLFEQIDAMGGLVLVVWDHVKNDFFYISERFFSYFGFAPSSVRKEKLAYPFKRMMPSDTAIVAYGAPLIWNYISSQPVDRRCNYKVVTEYRIKNDQGQLIRVQYHSIIFKLTDTGDVWLNMMLFEFATKQDMDTLGSILCIDVTSGEHVFTSNELKHKRLRGRLSVREIEVLKLVSQGHSSKQIASKLHISENTVNNHRRNIIRKLDVANSAEAVCWIKETGLF